MQDQSEFYIKRCFELAVKGQSKVAPNPLVGAVLVHNNQIIGEGYHEYFGGPHAEVNAINSVNDKSLLKDSTLYVNLEPCSHFGKTPPCANLIVDSSIAKVCIANLDPNEKVNGKGVEILRNAGIEVITGILENKGEFINRRFFKFHREKRPYVILKWAETSDGFISREPESSKIRDNWISNDSMKVLSHQWRAEEASILVGKTTVEIDDPQLTCREVSGNNPLRIILDRNLSINKNANAFNQEAGTIVFNYQKDAVEDSNEWIKFDSSLAEIPQILHKLFKKNLNSVIVEGGAKVLQSFIQSNLWDEARVIVGKKKFTTGLSAPKINGQFVSEDEIDGDLLKTYLNK